jgi:hypothetical protein
MSEQLAINNTEHQQDNGYTVWNTPTVVLACNEHISEHRIYKTIKDI